MKIHTLLTTLILPLSLLTACDKDDKDDKKSSDSGKNSDDGGDGNDDGGDGNDDGGDDGGGEPVWDCLCSADCDGAFLDFEETVCSDASTLELAIDIAVDECTDELSPECVEFSCSCDCEEDPDFECN